MQTQRSVQYIKHQASHKSANSHDIFYFLSKELGKQSYLSLPILFTIQIKYIENEMDIGIDAEWS